MELGRNEPCHCGSSKKYKKCCLSKDEQASIPIEPPKKKTFNSLDNDDNNGSWEDSDNLGMDYTDTNQQEDVRNYVDPDLNEEENRLVNEWWNNYDPDTEAKEVEQHIWTFAKAYPNLVDHLGLEHEVIFEMGAEYNRASNTAAYINFLIKFRKEFPSAYEKSAGYYDADIIYWLTAQGEVENINHYFSFFIKNPTQHIDRLFPVIHFLVATENITPLMVLINAVKEQLKISQGSLQDETITMPLIYNEIDKFIDSDDDSMVKASKFIDLQEALGMDLYYKDKAIKFWAQGFADIAAPINSWNVNQKFKKEELYDFYLSISMNYMAFLHDRCNLSWISAQYYSAYIYEYLIEILDNSKKAVPKILFDFSEQKIDKIGVRLCQDFLFINPTKLFSLLNSIHTFADYLLLSGIANEKEVEIIQKDSNSIFQKNYPALLKENTESRFFEVFPLLKSKKIEGENV